MFRDIQHPIKNPIVIHNDNQGAVQWSKGTTTKKMRWIDMRENFVRENVLSKTISVTHIPRKVNISDILTKEFKDVSHYLTARDSILINLQDFRNSKITPSKLTYKDALSRRNGTHFHLA